MQTSHSEQDVGDSDASVVFAFATGVLLTTVAWLGVMVLLFGGA